jgi:hypothetical protein
MALSPDRKHRMLRTAARMPPLLAAAALAAVLTGCGSTPISPSSLSSGSGIPGLNSTLDSGSGPIAFPVNDLNLEAMVPPDGKWITAGPLHGAGPGVPAVSLARVRGLHGTVNAVFMCHVTGRHPVTAEYTDDNDSGPLPCDPSLNTVNTATEQCSGYPCPGQSVFSFEFPNTASAVMPRFTISAGTSWVLFAWLAPPSTPPGAGVAADHAGLSQFAGYGLSFTYPGSWHSLAPTQAIDTDATALAFEGTAPMRDPCPVTTNSGGSSGGFPCSSAPVATLAPGGVLVYWSMTDDQDQDGGATYIGNPRKIAGRPGWLFSGPPSASYLELSAPADTNTTATQTGPTCRSLGANWVIEATVPMNAYSAYQMLACLRGPRNGSAVKEVLAIARSLRLGAAPQLSSS